MNYYAHLFFNHLPYVKEDTCLINGREEVCLIIPTGINQLKKGRNGNWLMSLTIDEIPPNEKMMTHHMRLIFLNQEEVEKAKENGYYYKAKSLGRLRVYDCNPSKKIDRANRSSDITLDGRVILSDIPKSLIFRNGENDKRYVNKLMLRSCSDESYVYVGALCVDDIPRMCVRSDQHTGKKYVDVRFKRLEYLDTYMNTHKMVIMTEGGAEIEIGKFREFKKETPETNQPSVNQPSVNPQPQPPPKTVNGMKF